MQKKIIYIVLLLCMYSPAFSQHIIQSGEIKFTGIIYDAQTSERIPFVHIIDLKRNKGTSASDHGYFSFSCDVMDSIKFTAIGYEDFFLSIDDSVRSENFLTIRLIPKTYLLQSLDFYANDPMKGFYLKDIERDTIHLGSKGMPGGNYWNGTPGGGTGYITAFANLFNRQHKQEKKMGKILAEEKRLVQLNTAEEERKNKLEEKYNTELVQRITDLKDEELLNFIDRYRPSDLFIIKSTGYEIALQIVNSYREYRFEKGLEVDVSEILKRAKFKD
ncbi:MAG: hypothetical protein KFF73_19890 [Cyclobacteriaceae bacterium]|nr:hypothetical protein [Cyclobacteriaceae bacterium]